MAGDGLHPPSPSPIAFLPLSLESNENLQAIIFSAQERPGPDSDDFSIRYSTHGIVFMGTPHLGSDLADKAETLINVVSVAMKTSDKMIKHLQQDSPALDLQGAQYGKNSEGIRTMYGHEVYETPTTMGQSKLARIP